MQDQPYIKKGFPQPECRSAEQRQQPKPKWYLNNTSSGRQQNFCSAFLLPNDPHDISKRVTSHVKFTYAQFLICNWISCM